MRKRGVVIGLMGLIGLMGCSEELTPEQQAWIIKLFQKAGYETNLEFDHYTRVYDFDH